MSEEQYASEFECDPYAAIQGAFYGKDIAAAEAEGRITALPPEPGVPVHTAWDLGHRHSTAIWFFQVVGPAVRIIDFYENHGQYADHYCGVVSARGYAQGIDFVPHDAKVHEWGTGKTRLETLIALGESRNSCRSIRSRTVSTPCVCR
jgi:phage terminase large subunit